MSRSPRPRTLRQIFDPRRAPGQSARARRRPLPRLPVADPLDDFLKACLAILRPVEAATGRLTDEIKEFFVEDRLDAKTRIDSDRVVLKICSE